MEEAKLAAFETGDADLTREQKVRLRHALETGGAVFVAEDHEGGIGVRLKFTRTDVRAINRLEGEGGRIGSDDV